MRVSDWLSAAICAGVMGLAGHALAEEASADTGDDPAASVEHGKALFTENCSTCHNGTVAPAPEVVGQLDKEAFDEKVKNHLKLEVFEKLSAQDFADIHAYEKSLAEKK